RVMSLIGEGGMGVVYRAVDVHLGREVALKMPSAVGADPAYRARFLDEAKAVSRLDHPRIARVYDYGEAPDGRPFLVMELVAGVSLSHLLSGGKLEPGRAAALVAQVAEALVEAHAAAIVHRDLKPSNIIVNDRDEVKVLDFGLAKQLEIPEATDLEAATRSMRTNPGTILGTPAYMSPEQAAGRRVDTRSDLFSLGLLLYECLCGRPAFTGSNAVDILGQVIYVSPKPPSAHARGVPPELERITMKALAKDAADRYQTASEVLEELRALRPRPRLWPARRQVLGVVAASVAAIAVWLLWPRDREPSPEAARWYQEGLTAIRDGTYYRASRALERATSLDPRFAPAHARLADALAELDYTEKAKEALLRALNAGRPTPLVEAVRLTLTRDFGGAVREYSAIAASAPAAEKAHALVDLGRAHEMNGAIPEALAQYQEAARRNPQYAAAFLRAGILEGRRQKLPEAESAFQSAEALYRTSNNLEGVGDVFFERGRLAAIMNKLQEARAHLEKALDLARTTASEFQEIRAMLRLSAVEYREGNTTDAERRATAGIDLARKSGMHNLTAVGLIDLGSALFVAADYARAEARFREALDVAEQRQMPRRAAAARFSLGSLFIQRSRAGEGLPYVEPALAWYRQNGFQVETNQALILVARAHRQRGDYPAALRAASEQLDRAGKENNPAQAALAHDALASILFEQERFPESLEQNDRAMEINRRNGSRLGVAYSIQTRARLLWRVGRYAEARSALDEVLAASGAVQATTGLALRSLAELQLSQGRYRDSIDTAQRALKTAGSQQQSMHADVKLVLALAYARSGRAVEGRRLAQQARDTGPANQAFASRA
ncbi:MAG: protein kinase domain-containing protein, partial [Bryobacteraceae bacterium]